jgi:hypothetical protein
VVALIHDEVAVAGDEVRDLALADQALDQCHVNPPARSTFAAADDPDIAVLE